MKKLSFLIIFILLLTQLLGIQELACTFTLINPSARGAALGNDSGAADIWDTSPLGAWSNPAKLGYHQGLAYSYTHTPWSSEIFQDILYGLNQKVVILLPSIKGYLL